MSSPISDPAGRAPILSEVRGAVLHVTIDRPEKRNALGLATLDALKAAFEAHAAHDHLKAAVLTGAGGKSFAAGGDLAEFDTMRSAEEGRAMAARAKAALDAVRRFPLPVVAALDGDALGGGAELAVACDFRVAAPHARIGFVQGRLAITTAWGGGADLFRLLPRPQALRLLATGTILPAGEAARLGLIDLVAADGDLAAAVDDFLAPMLSTPAQSLRAFKALALAGVDRAAADETEARNFAECWAHADHWAAHDRFMTRARGGA